MGYILALEYYLTPLARSIHTIFDAGGKHQKKAERIRFMAKGRFNRRHLYLDLFAPCKVLHKKSDQLQEIVDLYPNERFIHAVGQLVHALSDRYAPRDLSPDGRQGLGQLIPEWEGRLLMQGHEVFYQSGSFPDNGQNIHEFMG